MALDLIINEEAKELHIVTDEVDINPEWLVAVWEKDDCELFARNQTETIFLGKLKPEMSVALKEIHEGRWTVIDEISCTDTRVLEVRSVSR